MVGASSVARSDEPDETHSTTPRTVLPRPPAAARTASAAASSVPPLPLLPKCGGPVGWCESASAAATATGAAPAGAGRANSPFPAASAAADAATSSSRYVVEEALEGAEEEAEGLTFANPAAAIFRATSSPPTKTVPNARPVPSEVESTRKVHSRPMASLRRNSRAAQANGSSGVEPSRRPWFFEVVFEKV